MSQLMLGNDIKREGQTQPTLVYGCFIYGCF